MVYDVHMSSKEIAKLIRQLEAQGFTVRRTKGNHYLVRDAAGRAIATLAATPSDHRGAKNVLAELRRAGYVEEHRKR